MIFSLLIILTISAAGAVLTYFYECQDSLAVRLAAGNIIGSAFFGLIVFLAACGFGFSVFTCLISILLSLSPLVLPAKRNLREAFYADVKKSKQSVENINFRKILNLFYYAGFIVLFYFFFDRAMIETPEGIFTGGSNNLGDLPFHLGAIFAFTEGNNFPPENPSFAFAKFTYPFMTDLIAASFVKLGAAVRGAMLAQNITLALSLIVLFEKFTFKLTGNKAAGKIACLILVFSGGIGFKYFWSDYLKDGRGFFEFVNHLKMDYTIRDKILRWGNSLTTLFITQRGLLLGMPLTLIVLTELWEIFTSKAEPANTQQTLSKAEPQLAQNPFTVHRSPFTVFLIGLLAGTLPLIHVHSLAVLFVVCAFWFFSGLNLWREWIAFGAGVCLIAVPELVWTLTGSATNIGKFIGWHFGWEAGDENIIKFWLKNTGIFIPLLLASFFLMRNINTKKSENQGAGNAPDFYSSILFYLPFLFLFALGNTAKLAPWEWDNIKILIYWFVASIPFVALLLAKMGEKNYLFKILAGACLALLVFSGALDIWRTVSKQINYEVFDLDAIKLAEQIKQKTPPDALFLNAPAYNSPVVLTGRRSLMRYIGHISSYGIDFQPRYDEIKRIYEGSALAENLLRKNQIEYVVVNPDDAGWVTINYEYWNKFPQIAEAGKYRVYKVK